MRRLNFHRKTMYLILCILLIFTFTLTIAYAALSVTLNIVGNADVVASSWDVYLDNAKVTKGSVSDNEPSIVGGTTATFSTSLTTPGDFYEFTIDVVNDGSIDAMINSITKTPTLTETQSKYLNYIIEYQNGETINTKQLVSKKSFVRLKVRVEFRKDITASDLPSVAETLNLSFKVNYVQSDGSGNSVLNNGSLYGGINVVSGDGTTTGDEVCIGNECFYVMYSDDETVTMLAKYNLMVGYEADLSEEEELVTTLLSNPTGIQSSSAVGYMWDIENDYPTGLPWYGIITMTMPEINTYIEDYKNYLGSSGITRYEVRFPTYEDLNSIGCNSEALCLDAPSWTYSTSYWLSTTDSEDFRWFVGSDGYLGTGHIEDFWVGGGVRPVVVILRSMIDGTVDMEPNNDFVLIDCDGTETGDEVCIGDECFYVISNDGSSVSMLAKYNLYVGGEFDGSWKEYGIKATGKQNIKMSGYSSSGKPYRGTLSFSDTSYWSNGINSYPAYVYNSNSLLYNHVENYKNYLGSLGLIVNEARLITYDELIGLGCTNSNCYDAPKWTLKTSYWSGSATNSSDVMGVFSDGTLGYSYYKYNFFDYFGIRPVIVLSQTVLDTAKRVEKPMIQFTIDGVTYRAEKDTIWREWLDSEYNTDGYRNYYDRIILDEYDVMIGSTSVNANELIIADMTYLLG